MCSSCSSGQPDRSCSTLLVLLLHGSIHHVPKLQHLQLGQAGEERQPNIPACVLCGDDAQGGVALQPGAEVRPEAWQLELLQIWQVPRLTHPCDQW
jgi:hypothetical protein